MQRLNGAANANDYVTSLKLDSQGNVIVTGYQADSFDSANNPINEYTTLKLDTNGKSIWGVKDALSGNTNCTSNAVAVDSQDNIYITGMQGAYGNPDSEKIATEKYNPSGVSQWVQTYSRTGRASWGIGLGVNAPGDVFVTGLTTYVYNTNIYPDIKTVTLEALIKHDTNGNQIWVQASPATPGSVRYFTEIVRAITLDAVGNVYPTGIYNDADPDAHKSYFDTIKRVP